MAITPSEMDELCDRCGFRLGRHSASGELCPGSSMFVPSGRFKTFDEEFEEVSRV